MNLTTTQKLELRSDVNTRQIERAPLVWREIVACATQSQKATYPAIYATLMGLAVSMAMESLAFEALS